jgi:hypothetical protein
MSVGGFTGIFLWPAVVLHAILTILLGSVWLTIEPRRRLCIERLVEWMRSKDPKASPFAAKELLNRGWGRHRRITTIVVSCEITSSLTAR